MKLLIGKVSAAMMALALASPGHCEDWRSTGRAGQSPQIVGYFIDVGSLKAKKTDYGTPFFEYWYEIIRQTPDQKGVRVTRVFENAYCGMMSISDWRVISWNQRLNNFDVDYDKKWHVPRRPTDDTPERAIFNMVCNNTFTPQGFADGLFMQVDADQTVQKLKWPDMGIPY